MTDEERAEEYANNEINKMFVDESEDVFVRASTLKQIIKNSHLKGLVERRKESAKDIEVLTKENTELTEQIERISVTNFDVIEKLKAQIKKMQNFIFEEIDFCFYCPLTDTCRNDEGTCPYACATEEEQKKLLMDFIQKWELPE